MKVLKNNIKLMLTGLALTVAISSCQEKENDYAPQQPAIDGYVFSNDVAHESLVAHWGFEGNVKEDKSGLEGTATNTSFAVGIKGQAYKGSSTGFVAYETTPGISLKDLKSFTTTLWIKTEKHDGGAQCVFMLPRTSDFWGNMFVMIEGNNTTEDKMLIKVGYAGQWAELTGDLRVNGIYGKWAHLAFSYDAGTSKFAMFVNGAALTLPASITDRKNGSNPLGNLNMPDVSKFIIGAFQQQLGAPWSAPDGWMLPYTGVLDELRIFNKALTPKEIGAIYKLETKGR